MPLPNNSSGNSDSGKNPPLDRTRIAAQESEAVGRISEMMRTKTREDFLHSQRLVASLLKASEKQKLAHPLGGVHQPARLISKEKILAPLSDPNRVRSDDKKIEKPTITEIARAVDGGFKTKNKNPVVTEFSRKQRITYVEWVKALLLFAGVLFSMSLWINGTALTNLKTNSLEVLVTSTTAGGERACQYFFMEEQVLHRIDGVQCYAQDGETMKIWTNGDYGAFTQTSPMSAIAKNLIMIFGSGLFFFMSLLWLMKITDNVRSRFVF